MPALTKTEDYVTHRNPPNLDVILDELPGKIVGRSMIVSIPNSDIRVSFNNIDAGNGRSKTELHMYDVKTNLQYTLKILEPIDQNIDRIIGIVRKIHAYCIDNNLCTK